MLMCPKYYGYILFLGDSVDPRQKDYEWDIKKEEDRIHVLGSFLSL